MTNFEVNILISVFPQFVKNFSKSFAKTSGYENISLSARSLYPVVIESPKAIIFNLSSLWIVGGFPPSKSTNFEIVSLVVLVAIFLITKGTATAQLLM